jgi:hypothetical protein
VTQLSTNNNYRHLNEEHSVYRRGTYIMEIYIPNRIVVIRRWYSPSWTRNHPHVTEAKMKCCVQKFRKWLNLKVHDCVQKIWYWSRNSLLSPEVLKNGSYTNSVHFLTTQFSEATSMPISYWMLLCNHRNCSVTHGTMTEWRWFQVHIRR